MVNVFALIGDNCSVDQSISTKSRIPLIGCASHRFQLAVKDLLNGHEIILAQVQSLMVILRTPLIAAEVRRITDLKPKLRNDTRCSSTDQMVKGM